MKTTNVKKPYAPPALKSVKVFLPMLATTSGVHGHVKKPLRPFR